MAGFEWPFEAEVSPLLRRVRELRELDGGTGTHAETIAELEAHAHALAREIYAGLSPWDRVRLSRHPDRPYTLDILSRIATDMVELSGDRRYADDAAIVGMLARIRGRSCVVVGHQKGRTAKENMRRNFGMPHPEGYRKAERLYKLAERFKLPVITLIDTQGAYPGIGAEERGQSEAIGSCLATLSALQVPVVSVVLGEGGSGGALALGVANRVAMLEFSIYSVITPEGCASILWKDGTKAPLAAERLKITAREVHALGVVDTLIVEPAGGAHTDYDFTAGAVGDYIESSLTALSGLTGRELAAHRYRRFRALGAYSGPLMRNGAWNSQ